MNICMLNRKPYRDKHGLLRERVRCCGKKNEEGGCTLQVQPIGIIISDKKRKKGTK